MTKTSRDVQTIHDPVEAKKRINSLSDQMTNLERKFGYKEHGEPKQDILKMAKDSYGI